MTLKQNPVEMDAYACIHHAAVAGIPLEDYLKKVGAYARKRVKMITKGLRDA